MNLATTKKFESDKVRALQASLIASAVVSAIQRGN